MAEPTLYDDFYRAAEGSVSKDIAALHGEDLASCSAPGAWWNGEERRTLASLARAARCDAKLQVATGDEHASTASLPEGVRRLVTELAVRPEQLDRAAIDGAQGDGVSDAACVEVVGLVSRVVNHDVFARGLGISSRPLAPPVAGEPRRTRPATAIAEGGFLPSIPSGRRGGDEGRALYGDGMQPFIYRALSLVPDEARRNMALGDAQYLPIDRFFDFGYSHHPALRRAQVEVIAGRVSALNECFY
ncbi:MAG: hypothetical protein HKP27_01270 [Myxococcales bacterium]|nr:hypothetical protein [Myxococcales bacterium]